MLDNVKYQTEVGGYISTSGQTPFWQRANQYGVVPLQSPFITLRGSAHKEYDSTINSQLKLKKFGIGYGFGAVTNIGKKSGLFLPEAYLKVRYGIFEFYGGRRKEIIGLVDTTLTSGSYIWSGNALPMPKMQISIPNYTQIGKTAIFIKGTFAHGWFGNYGQVKGFYLHQKTLYGRIGRENAKLKLYGGFNHQVQWGGYNPSNPTQPFANNFYAYLYSVIPLKYVSKKASQSLTIGDLQNRVGNQLGTIDLGFQYQFPKYSLFVYRQNLYEQGAALLRLANIRDGLNGISVQNTHPKNSIFLKKITLEYFYSKNQGTKPLLFTKEVGWELENYFTHYQYLDGWSYNGRIIGTPLITTKNETLNVFPTDNQLVNNNRVKSYYLAFNLQLRNNFMLVSQNLYTSNSGRRFTNFNGTYKQFSSNIAAVLNHNNLTQVKAQLAFDFGKIYPNNAGVSFAIKKTWK